MSAPISTCDNAASRKMVPEEESGATKSMGTNWIFVDWSRLGLGED